MALRKSRTQSPVDCVETQPYDATQAAVHMQQDAIPILIEDSLPHELAGETAHGEQGNMCRSLARDFSKVNLSEAG